MFSFQKNLPLGYYTSYTYADSLILPVIDASTFTGWTWWPIVPKSLLEYWYVSQYNC